MHRFYEPTSCPDGCAPTWRHTTGNWRRIDFVAFPLHWLSSCSSARTWQNGELALQDGADHRAASFGSLVLVTASTKTSLPGEHSSSLMWLSVQKPFWSTTTGTLTEWNLPAPCWLASSVQRWLHLQRGAQKQIGSPQILGQLLSSTENDGSIFLRGSGSASPFSCGLRYGLGAFPRLSWLEKQMQTSAVIVSAVLGCAAKPSAFKPTWTTVCPLPFGLLSDISPRTRREGVRNQLLYSELHRVIWQDYSKMFPLHLRRLTPPLRLLSLILTIILRLWMPFRKLLQEKPLVPTSRQAAARFAFLSRLFAKVGDYCRAPLAKTWLTLRSLTNH